MIKVLFVCTGNICRSPTAEGVFVDLVRKAGLEESFFVDSAGTAPGQVNCPPDRRSAAECLKHGIDISSLRARAVEAFDLREFDYVIAMTDEHHRYLAALNRGGDARKILHFMKFVDGARGLDVPDPYIGEDGFAEVFDLICSGTGKLLDFIREQQEL